MSADRTEFALTLASAARAIGVHRHTLGGWVASGLAKREPEGFHLPTLRRLAEARREARQRRPGTEAERWLGELRRHRAETIALLNARTLGRLVPHSWVLEQHAARTAQIERDLGNLAERLVPVLERLGVHEVGRRRVGEELASLVRAYARPLPAPPPPPGPEAEDLGDDEGDDLLEHDDIRDGFPEGTTT